MPHQNPHNMGADRIEQTAQLRVDSLRLGYGVRDVVIDLSANIPHRGFTVIIGPNGCGKSTLLKGIGRLVPWKNGVVTLGGASIAKMPPRRLARQIALLPQSTGAPDGVSVFDLVARGRFPYQSLLRQWSNDDEVAVESALDSVGMTSLRAAPLGELSGGQRQRAWIAMALAQETPIMLLDEPTTYLDIAHQLEVLDLCAHLNEQGRTLIAVLHDLNLAARYATHILAMRDGRLRAAGAPTDVLTPDLLADVFDLQALVHTDPETGRPLIIPRRRSDSQQDEGTSDHPLTHPVHQQRSLTISERN